MIRRRGRFGEVIARQLDLFELDHAELIEDCRRAQEAYTRADGDDAEELYGDYLDLVETGTEILADLRDGFARTLDEDSAERYEEEFHRAVLKRLRPFALGIENT